jgi:hypothetical protein
MYSGSIKTFNKDKGFGFITPDDGSKPGYCRCSWQDWCFEHNKDCHACWQAWNDGRAWAEDQEDGMIDKAMQAWNDRQRMSESSYEEKLNRLEAELILSEASRDAEAAAASHAAEMKAEKKKAKKAAKKSKAAKKEKAAKKSKAEKKAAKKPKALRH